MNARVAMLSALAACTVNDVDYTGKQCPCPTGWDCNSTTRTCTRDLVPGDGGADSSVDGSVDASIDLTTGLVAWFELDALSGQLAIDSSSSSNHGYLASDIFSTWQPAGGVSGGALHFDGTPYQSFVTFPSTSGSCPNPISLPGSFTASAHVRFDAFGDWGTYSLSDAVLIQGTNGGQEGGWGLGATNGCGAVPRVGLMVAGTVDAPRATRCGTTQLTTGVWHHIIGVYDAPARSLEVYLDGVLDTGAMTPNSIPIPSQIFTPVVCPYMGASANQNALLRGTVDNARLYTRALSATDIAALFAQGG